MKLCYNAYDEVMDRKKTVRFDYTPLGSLRMREEDARIAAGDGKWSTSLKQELKYAKADLIAAGVPKKDVEKAMKEAKKHFKGCH